MTSRLVREVRRTSSAPQLHLVNDPDDITHLVCCRDVSWRRAFCGVEDTRVNVAAQHICTMCAEEVLANGGDLDADPPVCPIDGNPCPTEFEVDQRIAQETDPTP